MTGHLENTDPEVAAIVERELERQRTTLQLIASENFASPAVLAATGSVLTNKYSEGYPGKRYYGGNEVIDEVEALAIDRAKQLFGADHANVQSHSGASANMAVYLALLDHGDKVMGMRLDQGGHLTHGSPVNASGILYDFVAYGVREDDEHLDYDNVREVALRERPKLIVAGATAYPRQIDFAAFRAIADEVGAVLMVDAAHIMGLIAGGAHPSPVPYADVVTSTTHKTLRGPRGAMILCREEYAQRIDKAVFPGSQGGPLDHVVAAKAVCFHEAMQPSFKEYASAIVDNAQALASALEERGVRCVSGGTDNHLVLADLRSLGVTGRDAEKLLDRAGISLNRNTVPNDPEPPLRASGVRLGTAAETTAGMGPDEMAVVSGLIVRALRGGEP
ncbi:MAG: serine hydroxymethyltransferase, partial [Actinobacteria bacterium ATB1]|nr:serine hydroxymethyltransferase [Actinobacteria bacterium ATB1]